MARLEYRLYTEGGETFPVLYYYEQIGRDEAALRFACDYFVKSGRVYEKNVMRRRVGRLRHLCERS